MERFIDWDHIQFGYKVLGNPNLKPESSIGYSFEIENYKLSKYQTTIRLYHTGFDNLIEDYAISPGILRVSVIKLREGGDISPKRWWSVMALITGCLCSRNKCLGMGS